MNFGFCAASSRGEGTKCEERDFESNLYSFAGMKFSV
jgi:hypothetical protein